MELRPGLVVVLALLWVAPTASAGTPQAPEITDPPGDVYYENAVPAQGPKDAVDLLGAWIANETADSVDMVLHVKDLGQVASTQVGVQADTMWVFNFKIQAEKPQGRAARPGEWYVRADFAPMNSRQWDFWAEAPCIVYHADNSCAGNERDIIEGLDGTYSNAASTVTIVLPRSLIGNVSHGDALNELSATAQMVWPSYPVYAGDWAYPAKKATGYVFQEGAAKPGSNASATQGPTEPVRTVTITAAASPGANAKGAASAAELTVLLLAAGAAITVRRRQPH